VTAQTQQALAVRAKRIQAHRHWSAIRPQYLIAFEGNLATVTIFRWIATKHNS
jgi:hypothetical protein